MRDSIADDTAARHTMSGDSDVTDDGLDFGEQRILATPKKLRSLLGEEPKSESSSSRLESDVYQTTNDKKQDERKPSSSSPSDEDDERKLYLNTDDLFDELGI